MLKKSISVLLSVLMVFSLFVIQVYAEDVFSDAVSIGYGEKVTLDFPDSMTDRYLKFVADKTMVVMISSDEESSADPCCAVYSADGEEIAYADDSVTGYNFNCKFDVVAGETYYIVVSVFDEDAVSVAVSLGCGHTYDGSICIYCGHECNHEVSNMFGECDCRFYFLGKDLQPGVNTIVCAEDETTLYRFIPEEDGIYFFRSESADTDPYCYLIDAEDSFLIRGDDENDLNFEIFRYMEAGKSYFFEIYDYNGEAEWTATLERFVHSVDDEPHNISYDEGYYGNCTEICYTHGIYCEDCGEYIYGHDESGYGFHEDDDFDSYCDYCGVQLYEEMPSGIEVLGDFVIRVIEFFKNFFLTLFTILGIW